MAQESSWSKKSYPLGIQLTLGRATHRSARGNPTFQKERFLIVVRKREIFFFHFRPTEISFETDPHTESGLTVIMGMTLSVFPAFLASILLHILIREYCPGLWNTFREDWKIDYWLATLLLWYGSFCDCLCVNVIFKESIGIKIITVIISRYIW